MTTDNAAQTTAYGQGAVRERLDGRNRLARLVVVGSFLTLFLLVGALLVLAQKENTTASEAAKNAFNAILPVLAGWVGTVLAFYFSAASQEISSASLDKAIAKPGGGSGDSTSVSEEMIPLSSILGLKKLEEKQPKEILISDLRTDFEPADPKLPKITRLLFTERGVFRYVVHIGTLNAFILKRQAGTTATPPTPFDLATATFADMLADEETLRQIAKLVVFVSASTSLGDAKTALDNVNGAQDIIVTGGGNATEPMLGWLSNVDLTKALQVN